MKKANWLLMIICSAGMILYIITMLPQDVTFNAYKKAFKQIQHPANSEFIRAYNSFGALDKTRVMYRDDFPQGCDYRVAQVRSYVGTQESIEAFYTGTTIVVNDNESSVGIMFIPMDTNGRIDSYGLSDDEAIKWGPGVFDILEDLKQDQDFGFLKLKPLISYYFVSSGGFSLSTLDIRCQF